ncbi:unnamed protein product [Diabrotica balteata]|uniref:Nucleoporin Nup54 alpha-helical domain-containing protein n=1 Tax=Diabrotica balteata TaxID=107213 RepID=A0A9N9T7P6_DIABA|nr:unnamed protein product [Diabrotica balteata]
MPVVDIDIDHRVVLVMESNFEIKEEFVESDQRLIENQLSTSTDPGDLKNGPQGNSARAVKTEIKDEFVEDDPRYVESQISTSLDMTDLKNEPDDYSSDKAIKSEIKEEFVEDDPRYLESQISTSLDMRDLKNEPDDYNSDKAVKSEIKEEFVEDDPRYIESQLSTSLDLGDLKNEDTSVMESNFEIKEEFVESDQRLIENQLSTSTDPGDLKNGPQGNSARAVKTEIKDEFVEDDPRYVESQISTSLDMTDLKNEPDDYSSDKAIKSEIKEEFVEDDPRYLESQISTSLDMRDLKNEPDDYNSDKAVKSEIKEEFVEDDPRYIESQLSTSLDLGDLKNEDTSGTLVTKNIIYLFGSTTTSSLFGQQPTAPAPSLFGTATSGTSGFGTGTSLFGSTTTTSAPSLFGTGFGSTTTTGGFGGFGGTTSTFGGFGQQAQTSFFGKPAVPPAAPQQVPPSKNQQVLASVYSINVFNDERDDILKKWNMLQACWGTGKGYYNGQLPPIEYDTQSPFYRFKAMGYNVIPEHDNTDGIVKLVFNKKIDEMKTQSEVLKNGISGILGNKPNLVVEINQIRALSANQTEVRIVVQEKGVTGTSRKIPASDLANFLNQPMPKQQLSTVMVTSITPYVTPSKAELEEYLKNPPSGTDLQMWRAAIDDNPDPKKYIPVPVNGFSTLRSRLLNQEHQTGLHQAFLDKVNKEITDLKIRHSASVAKSNELKSKFYELQHRILRILVKQECTRKVGVAILPEEEILRGRLETMYQLLHNPKQFKISDHESSHTESVLSALGEENTDFQISGPSVLSADTSTYSKTPSGCRQRGRKSNPRDDLLITINEKLNRSKADGHEKDITVYGENVAKKLRVLLEHLTLDYRKFVNFTIRIFL